MDMLEKIRDILSYHKGAENKITSREIASLLGIVEDATTSSTRALLLKAAEKYELPLAADADGYYILDTEEEFLRYDRNLQRRISGIEKRRKIIEENFKKKSKKREAC